MKTKPHIFLALTAFFSFSSFSPFTNEIPKGLLGSWIWEKSVSEKKDIYTSTPRTMGFRKKILFTENGFVITYKNDCEIRNNKYSIEKGISVHDSLQHDLISFEGAVYVIEKLDSGNLTLRYNSPDGPAAYYKRK